MEIRPIISALMRSKVALILIGLQIALTLAIVCNALFIISQRIETMNRPSGMNEADTFRITSNGFGASFNTKNAFAEDLAMIRGLPGVADASPMNTTPMADSGWSEAIMMAPGQKVATTGAAIYFVDEHGLNSYGLDLVAGRNFKQEEISVRDRGSVDWPPGIIITKALADKLYPGQDAIGKQMYLGDPDKSPAQTVIGVIDRMIVPWPRGFTFNGDRAAVEYSVLVPQLTAYGSSTTASAAAYADLIALFVTAPEFMYFVEHGDTAISGQTGVYDVSPYELASRLSYQLWQTAPDDALLSAAADGSLRDATTYNAQVARLLADPRARPALDEFFADWMKVEDLPALDAKNADATFKTFAGADLPDAKLRQAMIDDVVGMLDYYTWTTPAGISALLTSDLSFARDARLAKLYGVAAWNGTGAPPTMPAGQRPGLLTRALFLSTGTANTRPIMKGVFLRTNVLCDTIPPPPPGANAKPPDLGPNMTTRESVEAITEMPGTICLSCHGIAINPLGFATEGFDSLARFRTTQRLFDAAGVETGTKPVNTMSVPQVVYGDTTAVSTPAELMSLMAGSGKIEACLARNFFRYTYGRWEDTTIDGCALEDARKTLANGGTIADLAAAAVKTAQFKRRSFQ